jgi:hypothetical protein
MRPPIRRLKTPTSVCMSSSQVKSSASYPIPLWPQPKVLYPWLSTHGTWLPHLCVEISLFSSVMKRFSRRWVRCKRRVIGSGGCNISVSLSRHSMWLMRMLGGSLKSIKRSGFGHLRRTLIKVLKVLKSQLVSGWGWNIKREGWWMKRDKESCLRRII